MLYSTLQSITFAVALCFCAQAKASLPDSISLAPPSEIQVEKGFIVGFGFNQSFLSHARGNGETLQTDSYSGIQATLEYMFAVNDFARVRAGLDMAKTNYSVGTVVQNGRGFGRLGIKVASEFYPGNRRRLYALTEFTGILPVPKKRADFRLQPGFGMGWAKQARKGVHRVECLYQYYGPISETVHYVYPSQTWKYNVHRVVLRWLFI